MLQTVYTKAHKQFGVEYPAKATEYQTEIIPGQSIRIVCDVTRGWPSKIVHFDQTFKVGDKAEYNSYNLKYYGTITRITKKQVWIEHYGKTYRLDLYTFCWRNYDFNLAAAAAHNEEESYCI